jgi:hypothetical protein
MRILGGEIECKIHTTAAGYSDEQTHHWLIGCSGAITHNHLLHIAATWSVTGNGKLAETQGNQTRKAHWNTQGTKPAPMQVRLSSPTVPATPPTIILGERAFTTECPEWHRRATANAGSDWTPSLGVYAVSGPALES